MKTVLKTTGLTKKYGALVAVNNLSLEIRQGCVFGLLGPNGSGKSTTLGMLLDVIQPSSGSYLWFGKKGTKHQRKKIGAILENPIFYPYLSAFQNLKIVAKIKEVPDAVIPEVLNQVGLLNRQHDTFNTYSLGMKQRLAIASALVCNPEVLILDEPTNGLDPQGIAEIRELITQIAAQGKTIILASHLLDEVQKVCTDFAILKQGNLIYTGKVDEVQKNEATVIVQAAKDLASALKDCPIITQATPLPNGKTEVVLVEDKSVADLNEWLFNHQIIATHLEAKSKSLEKQFLELLETNQ